MKIITLVLLGLFSASQIGFAQDSQPIQKKLAKKTAITAKPTLQVASDRIDLGQLPEVKRTEVKIPFTNTGLTPIHVSKVSSTAFIEVGSFPKTAIAPGDTGAVVLMHVPVETGDFLETVVIESDATNPMQVLKVFGTILTAEQVNSSETQCGQ